MNAAHLDPFVDDHAEDAFMFLEDLVRADSTVGREHEALDVLSARFAQSGFAIERVPIPADVADGPPGGVGQMSYDGRYDVVARLPARGGRSLMFNGHIDVVPPGDVTQWTAPPFQPERRNGWLYGRGGGDMKAGFAMGWLALHAVLHGDPGLITGDLSLLAVIEEECTGNGTLAACRAGHLADAVVVLEPTDLGLLLAGVGVLWMEIVVQGSAGHAYAADRSASALDSALDVIAGLKEIEGRLNADVDDQVFVDVAQPYNVNIGVVGTGDWQSSVPSTAVVGVRFGFPRAWTAAQAIDYITKELATVSAESVALSARPMQVRPNGYRAEGYSLDSGSPLVTALQSAHHAAHGTAAETFALGSTTDARYYVNHFDTPAVCYGPRARDIHGIDERVELQSIVDGAKTLTRFIAGYFAEDGP